MPPRFRIALLITSMVVVGADGLGQSPFAPRSEALASSPAMVRDLRGFSANPAGMTEMKAWDVLVGTSVTPGVSGNGFVFEGVALGRRFLERHAVGLQYTPGTVLEAIQRASSVVAGITIPTNRLISYAEPGAAAYAFRWNNELSVGIMGRLRTEKVTDPQYEYRIQDTSIVSVQHEFSSSSWFIDLGAQWRPNDWLSVSAVGRSLLAATGGSIPAEYAAFRLPHPRAGELDVAARVTGRFWCSVGGATEGRYRFGAEWNPVGALNVRAGAYASGKESPFVYALCAGAGWSYAFFDIDASYLRFTNQTDRQGTVSAAIFDPSAIRDIRLNPYANDRAALSFRAMLGLQKESLARIEGVEMLGGVYPSSAEALAYKPVGKVHVKNISQTPIQARALFFVDQFMDSPTESPQVYIAPGDIAVIPMTAVFNDRLHSVPRSMIREGTVSVTATVAEDFDDKTQTRVLIHGKNDWDGDIRSLRYFVTPDDPEIIRYSRDVLLEARDSAAAGPKVLNAFRNARTLFTSFAGKMAYVSDPMQSADYVQYPAETLKLRGGDCDDMTVCFASLLSSVGIGTAFVDVVPPGHPDKAHVYLLFDSGVPPSMGAVVSSNEKRFITRKSKSGQETLWIPVETTVVTKGFESAWEQGAREFFEDVEVQLGLIRGWVNIVDVY